jgi:hypothetical protein
MTLDETGALCTQIRATQHQTLADDLIQAAVRYARLRVDWLLATPEARREMDPTRRHAHNAFIDACNILSRNMQQAGEDNGWRARIGNDRQTIGDFACYLHCLLGIRAR